MGNFEYILMGQFGRGSDDDEEGSSADGDLVGWWQSRV